MPLLETKGAGSAQGFGLTLQQAAANYIEDVFSTWLYTGTGSSLAINNGIDLSTKGGLVWGKDRVNNASNHILIDTNRWSAGANALLYSNLDVSQQGYTQAITAFSTTGFTLGTGVGIGGNNANGTNYASWTFRKQPKFFDVVTWTGDGSASRRAISHSLGSVPGCIITKRTDSTGTWWTYHRANPVGPEYSFELNTTGTGTNGVGLCDIPPTSTVFYVNSVGGTQYVNINGATYVAYIFAHNAGGFGLTGTDNVISCGSFTTDGSGNATVSLGYEPQWVLIKQTDGVDSWYLNDNMRGMAVSGNQPNLSPNSSAAESAGGYNTYPNATGFTASVGIASKNYIYIAIRRGPMKTPTTGTSVYTGITRTGTGANATVTGTGFPVDLLLSGSRNAAFGTIDFDRLRGATQRLFTYSTAAEAARSTSLTSFAVQDGYTIGNDATDGGLNNSGQTYIYWNFRRAPGFFDVVCYTGTGTNTTQAHNLGVAPEMMIVKRRNDVENWYVYHAALGATKRLKLNLTDAEQTALFPWNNTAPTSTVFSLANSVTGNGAGDTYVWYGFATVAGVSKVGSYTGTGALQTVNCGFTGGARFVLIKRTDSTGDWWVYDSARGITSGNDPYLLMNSTAAEVTGTNYVDTTSVGFQVTAAAPAGLNANGGTFVFLAIS